MGETITLVAADGHRLGGYRAEPEGPRRGALVVIQEVFGVNAHIRDVCDRFADLGYAALAPALFDRLEPGVELDYDAAGIERGRALVGRLGWEHPLTDVAAAAAALGPEGTVGVVGYCWGGTVTWLAACRLRLGAAAAYYGRQIVDFVAETPQCPIILHFGGEDALIPLATVDRIKAAHPTIPIYVYEAAGHGFNCDRRGDFRPEVAALALERTLDLFAQNLR